MRAKEANWLKNSKFAVLGASRSSVPHFVLWLLPFRLGFGDSNYDKFCEQGKQFDRMFAQAGAQRLLPLALADEVYGLEGVVDPWRARVVQV